MVKLNLIRENYENNLIIFDDNCLLCNWAVRMILRFDKRKIFRFTSFDSKYCERNIKVKLNKESVVLVQNNELFVKSQAIFKIIHKLSFPVNLISILRLVPQKYSDFLYDFISSNRKKIFNSGKKKCLNLYLHKNRFCL